MDKQNEMQKLKLNEISQGNKPSTNESGCIHYKRKAKFVVSKHISFDQSSRSESQKTKT